MSEEARRRIAQEVQRGFESLDVKLKAGEHPGAILVARNGDVTDGVEQGQR